MSAPSLNRLRLAILLAAGLMASPAGTAAQPTRVPEMPPLNGGVQGRRLPGKFVWADLVTDDLAAAQRFYGSLFGWKFYSIHPGYVVAELEERVLAGILQRPKPKDRPAQPRWIGFMSVASVERAGKAVVKAGGRVLAPKESLPRRGEQAIFADPEGAVFGVLRSSSGDPDDVLAAPGEWIWIQMLSRDGGAATSFYRAVAGYKVVENDTPGRASDFVLTSEGYARATIRTLRTTDQAVQATWLPFVRVTRVAEAVARVRELGGTIRFEPSPDVLQGRVAIVADPTGASIGIMEWDETRGKGGR